MVLFFITDPARTPGGSKAPKTPSGGDRFIPNRSATQFELGHFKITTDSASNSDADNLLSPSQKEYQKLMSENLNGTDISNNKIISYKTKAPSAPEGTCKLQYLIYMYTIYFTTLTNH